MLKFKNYAWEYQIPPVELVGGGGLFYPSCRTVMQRQKDGMSTTREATMMATTFSGYDSYPGSQLLLNFYYTPGHCAEHVCMISLNLHHTL